MEFFIFLFVTCIAYIIKIEAKAVLPKKIQIPETEFCVLIGNMLDNSMEVLTAYGAPYAGFLFYFLVPFMAYFVLKCALTKLVCKNRAGNANLTLLKGNAMPVCVCKEALTVKQVILIYLAPFAFIYTPMFFLCVLEVGEEGTGLYNMATLFLSFFWKN